MPATIEQYAGSAKAVLQGSALPYGYTVTLPLASFAATAVYLALASLQLALARRQGRRSSS
jgi:hypothetical protein